MRSPICVFKEDGSKQQISDATTALAGTEAAARHGRNVRSVLNVTRAPAKSTSMADCGRHERLLPIRARREQAVTKSNALALMRAVGIAVQ
jgi:hypothetical protein